MMRDLLSSASPYATMAPRYVERTFTAAVSWRWRHRFAPTADRHRRLTFTKSPSVGPSWAFLCDLSRCVQVMGLDVSDRRLEFAVEYWRAGIDTREHRFATFEVGSGKSTPPDILKGHFGGPVRGLPC